MSKITQMKEYVTNAEVNTRVINGNATKDIDIAREEIIKQIYKEKMKKISPLNSTECLIK